MSGWAGEPRRRAGDAERRDSACVAHSGHGHGGLLTGVRVWGRYRAGLGSAEVCERVWTMYSSCYAGQSGIQFCGAAVLFW
jgi:hypothetical protein